MRVDLHSHSTVSDGLDSPAELVRLMAYAGISAFALTDHDSLQGLPEARREAETPRHRADPGRGDLGPLRRAGRHPHPGALRGREERPLERAARDPPGEPAAAGREDGRRSSSRPATRSTSRRSARRSGTASGGARTWRGPSSVRATPETTTTPSTGSCTPGVPWYVALGEVGSARRRADRSATAGGISSLAHAVWYKDVETDGASARRRTGSTRSRSSIRTTARAGGAAADTSSTSSASR